MVKGHEEIFGFMAVAVLDKGVDDGRNRLRHASRVIDLIVHQAVTFPQEPAHGLLPSVNG